LKGWLERHKFPVQPNSVNTAATAKPTELSGELVGLAGQGVHMDVAYTNNRDDVLAFQTAGISKIFALGDATSVAGATRVANDDLVGLVDGIEAQRRVCS
jgi:hypothetical protein